MAAAVLIAVGFGVVSWFQGAASKDGMSPAPDTASTGVGRAASGPAPAFVAAPPEVPARNQVQRVESRLKIGDDYYAIRTQEELRWYERNGYPSRDTIQAAMSGWAGVADLNASDGISPWEMVRAEQLAVQRPDQSRQAVDFLEQAARQGSLYALEALGRVMSAPPFQNKLQAEAYYKAGELRGNWSAALRITPYELTQQESVLASLQAQQILDNIDHARGTAGLAPLARDVRPGLEQTLDALANSKP